MALAVSLVTGLVAGGAWGQCDDCQRFRVLDLGELGAGFNFEPEEDGSFGMNDAGEIVFWTIESGTPRGHVWLPEPNPEYGLDAGLHALEANSVARDINNDGLVVGQIGGMGLEGRAAMWDLNQSSNGEPPDAIDLGVLEIGEFVAEWSRAFAITDGPEPVITGESEQDGFCDPCCDPCPPDPEATFVAGFRQSIVNGQPQPMSGPFGSVVVCPDPPDPPIEPIEEGTSSRPRDVAFTSSGLRMAGWSSRVQTGGSVSCGGQFFPCSPELNPAWWDTLNVATKLQLPGGMSDAGSVARGINVDGRMVGWGYESATNPCSRRAVLWNDAGGIEVSLGELLLPPFPDSRAEAITDASVPQIVGRDEDFSKALLWEFADEEWHAHYLEDLAGPTCDWLLRFAHDINENGWIVCHGFDPPASEPRLLLLVPTDQPIPPGVPCLADLDDDGEVEVDDLLILLAEWGNCPCRADIDGDCEVRVEDLLILLGAWGPCGQGGAPVPKTVADCINRFGFGDPIALQKCIEAVTGNLP